MTTTLGGTLVRHADGWRWSDGTPEPRVRSMPLRALAPNFRCCTYGGGGTYVEIPKLWRSAGLWPRGVVDPDAARAIDGLIREVGKPARIYAEGLAELRDDHRLRRDGYIVPIAAWDAVMGETIGAEWDREHEEAILAKAKELGWRDPR